MPNIPPEYLERQHLAFQCLRNFKMLATPVPEERVRRARSAYYGMITELDRRVGQILSQLEKTDALRSTLVVYTSDHGEMLGEHGLWLKNVLLEGAARVPLILAGAGLPQGKRVDMPVSHVDLVATLLELARIPKPDGLRGDSLLPLITGESPSHPECVYAESHSEGNCTGSFMIRKGDWKYVYFSWYGDNLLFNLRDDPGELNNLAGNPKQSSVLRELHTLLTTRVEPDTITKRGFEKQDQVLITAIREKTAKEFYQTLESRLGRGQAAALTDKYYHGARLSPALF
jgi:choline-sulfatase